MRIAIACCLQIIIALGIFTDHWLNINEVGNITIVLVWIMSLLSFSVLFTPSKELYQNYNARFQLMMRILFTINTCLLFAVGWFFTGIIFLLAWIGLWAKRIIYEDELKGLAK